ncbi:MAG TPA: DedA family protein [Stellaceae bacterium]|nr:DedA family protein [Stellaceae bacterium]
MSLLSPGELQHFIATYGYGAVAGIIAAESMGLPLPGEATLIAAALVAGSSGSLNIWLVIAAAAGGAILGDTAGYWIGRKLGYWLILRFGRYVGLTERRIKLGQFLFRRYGGAVVFFGRFVAVLRALAAFLAGANDMDWPRFFLFNASGAILWAAAYGLGAWYLGKEVSRMAGPVGIGIAAAALAAVATAAFLLWRREEELEEKAEQALPGPLRPLRRRS